MQCSSKRRLTLRPAVLAAFEADPVCPCQPQPSVPVPGPALQPESLHAPLGVARAGYGPGDVPIASRVQHVAAGACGACPLRTKLGSWKQYEMTCCVDKTLHVRSTACLHPL
eukprot:1147912-Pelagomonas_calceolata.AAC.3